MMNAIASDLKIRRLRKLYFWGVFAAVLVEACCEVFCLLLQRRVLSIAGGQYCVLFLNTIKEGVALYLVRQWILYIDYIMHKSIDHLKRHYRHMIIPIAVLTAMYVINLFYPILFLVEDDYTISHKPLFYIIRLIVLIAFLYPVLEILKHRKRQKESIRRLVYVLLVFAVIALNDLVSGHRLTVIAHVIVFVLIVFLRVREWRFEDRESGYKSLEYLHHLKKGKDDAISTRPTLHFIANASYPALVKILNEELPKDSEVIRTGEGEFILIGEKGDKRVLREIGEMVMFAAEEYDDEHPEEAIGLSYEIT